MPLISTSRNNPAAPPYDNGPYTWDQVITFSSTVTIATLTVTGNFTFGDAAIDALIVNGKISTVSAAGSAIDIDATVSDGNGMEMRYTISSWAGLTGNEFNGMYMRPQSDTDNASGVIHGIITFAVANASGILSLQGGFTQAYIKGDSTDTIGTAYGIHGEVSFDASRSNTLTITTEMCAVLGKILSGVVDDFTKIHGAIFRFGDMDGNSRTYGNGILIEDDSATSGTSVLTTGINMTIACTTGISMSADATTGIHITSGMTPTDAIKIDSAGTTGILVTGATTSAQIKVEGTAIIASGEQAIYVNCAAETAANNGIWVTLKSNVTSGDLSGARIKVHGTRLSSGGASVRGVYSQAIADTASSFNIILQGGLFVASYEGGSVTATDIYGVTGFINEGASLTASGNLAAIQGHLQTRGDETVSGTYTGLLLTNEAVNGNGSKLDAYITCTETSLAGGIHGADYLIDCGTNTDIIDTAILRVGDDQTIASDDNQSILVDISATANAGFLKVVVGTSDKYIALYDLKSS